MQTFFATSISISALLLIGTLLILGNPKIDNVLASKDSGGSSSSDHSSSSSSSDTSSSSDHATKHHTKAYMLGFKMGCADSPDQQLFIHSGGSKHHSKNFVTGYNEAFTHGPC
jgi:hypothetical protein